MKVAAAALAVASTLLVCAPPAWADLEQDSQFIKSMQSAGLKITNPASLISHANMVCNEGLAHGVSVSEMHTTLISWGYSSRDASILIDKAISVYCPKYAGAQEGAAAPTASAGPTYADGDEFTEEVYNHGILQNLNPTHLDQILANICYHKREGLSRNLIVSFYMDGYGLSGTNAGWLVDTAQKKCD
ncbi:DUF732 domain-containing protein [Mycolicibacterium sp. BiH015]|uniref:DUF732 domain-containing protein n=1 Tax=Mycolicibacterium sp. BiH015 TaxID=3018808 RepID=UPI0022E4C136|nr:DUF732 domain-containing protein [Mycolicibacterium sp. BiH015]MDA2895505.1 DUF732 domain-containing protein [Mycolicibacterium sp. BiH015]